jgi:sec-independent protein translocase protein TatA
MGSLGGVELAIILVIVLLIFGGTLATRLPKLARSIGQSSNEFKKGLKEGQEDGVDKDADVKP